MLQWRFHLTFRNLQIILYRGQVVKIKSPTVFHNAVTACTRQNLVSRWDRLWADRFAIEAQGSTLLYLCIYQWQSTVQPWVTFCNWPTNYSLTWQDVTVGRQATLEPINRSVMGNIWGAAMPALRCVGSIPCVPALLRREPHNERKNNRTTPSCPRFDSESPMATLMWLIESSAEKKQSQQSNQSTSSFIHHSTRRSACELSINLYLFLNAFVVLAWSRFTRLYIICIALTRCNSSLEWTGHYELW